MPANTKRAFPTSQVGMPCQPRDLKLGYYELPLDLGSRALNEAACRVLAVSHQRGYWCGPTKALLLATMQRETAAHQAQAAYAEAERVYAKQMFWWSFWNVLTLLMYGHFACRPYLAADEPPRYILPQDSVLFEEDGEQLLCDAFELLVDYGLLQRVGFETGKKREQIIYFPTEWLVQRVLAAQEVRLEAAA